ncbi:MAG: serine/threonine protein kinase [Peptococcaceae bacterium]|nr:serine/threonine protein kinase [Peptococcaceae bacterium]
MPTIKQYEPLWNTWYIDSFLGKGSFGEVYKIRRDTFGTPDYSAVKIISIPHDEEELRNLRDEGLDDISIHSFLQALLSNLVSEIYLMNELRGNSNIVSFEDFQVIEKPAGSGWDMLIRMELLDSLTSYTANRSLSQAEIVKLGIHICRALELCAQKRIIHRDIKPGNIFVSQYGEYKLGDFGIARQLERTASGLSKKGTYTYMAPEVFRGEQYGPSVDTYSLGIVLYRFLNHNRVPFLPKYPQPIMPNDRDTALQMRMGGCQIPHLEEATPHLNEIVKKACNYNAHLRYESSTEMRMALESEIKRITGEPELPLLLTVPNPVPPAAAAHIPDSTKYSPNYSPNYSPEYNPNYSPEYSAEYSRSPQKEMPFHTPAHGTSSPRRNKGSKTKLFIVLGAIGIGAIALAAVLIISLGLWENTDGTLEDDNTMDHLSLTDDTQSDDTLSDDDLYNALSQSISFPLDAKSDDFPKTITFTAKITGKAKTMEGKDDHIYMPALIARNSEEFLLDVSSIEDSPKVGEIISVTGTLNGSISWEEKNNQHSILDINVESFKPVEQKNVHINTGPKLEVSSRDLSAGTFDFKGAHFTKDETGRDAIAIYFTFSSTAKHSSIYSGWIKDKLYISLGDNEDYLKHLTLNLKEVDSSAQRAYTTFSGVLHFSSFQVPQGNKNKTLYIKAFDDDFNATDIITLDVAASLAQMKHLEE